MSATAVVSQLWFIDRTRIVDGRGVCERARYLNNHSGPTGYGIARKAMKLPLVTGILGHDALRPILEWCMAHDAEIVAALALQENPTDSVLIVPRSVVNAAIDDAHKSYYHTVSVRGFAYLDTPEVQNLTTEQAYLIAGLVWAWVIEVLPEILRRGKIVEVEHDASIVFDCTCGLGEGVGAAVDHDSRGCQGKALMCKPDFVVETRVSSELEYHEFKTTGVDSPSFRDKWEVMLQMFSATLEVEKRLGKPVGSIYIHGLVKGKRQGDYNAESQDYSGPKRQQSVCCYGYRAPAVPPMETEEWMPRSKNWDEFEGRVKGLPKRFKKAPIWELPESVLPEGMGRSEWWMTRFLESRDRAKCLALVGPLTKQDMVIEGFFEEMSGEETRWQDGVWQLYELGTTLLEEAAAAGSGHAENYWAVVWADARFQSLLNRLFPRSYECRKYGAGHRCQFEDPCFYREGWADPIGSGQFVDRRPHHVDEMEQAIARGLLPPDEGLSEDAEEAEGAWS